MSDFLSSAINDVLKGDDMDKSNEKNFRDEVRKMAILAAIYGFKGYPTNTGGLDMEDFIKDMQTLLLDTIEKAKPPAKLPSEINDGGNTFNNGVSAFEQALVKEIKK